MIRQPAPSTEILRDALWQSAGAIRLIDYAALVTALDELDTLRAYVAGEHCCCGLLVRSHYDAHLAAVQSRGGAA